MLEIGDIFLHQETNLSQMDVDKLEPFDKYYETRQLINQWNQLPKEQLQNKILSLEIQGFIIC